MTTVAGDSANTAVDFSSTMPCFPELSVLGHLPLSGLKYKPLAFYVSVKQHCQITEGYMTVRGKC